VCVESNRYKLIHISPNLLKTVEVIFILVGNDYDKKRGTRFIIIELYNYNSIKGRV